MSSAKQGVPVAEVFSDMTQLSEHLFRPDITTDESQTLYNQWASLGTYDTANEKANYFIAYDMLMAAVLELFPNRNERHDLSVLDVGAGTGVIGQKLRDAGFDQVHALDPSREMLKVAESRGAYRRYICSFFTQHPVDCIAGDSYDLLVMCGVIGPGAIPVEAFTEAVRVLKPGGYVVNCMRAEYMDTCPEYRGRWEPFIETLIQQGKLRRVSEDRYPGHIYNYEGLRHVYQVL